MTSNKHCLRCLDFHQSKSRQRPSVSGRNKPDPLSDEIAPPNVHTSTQKYKNTGGRVKKHSLGSKSRHQCPFCSEHLYSSLFKVALYCPLVSTGLTCFWTIQDLLHFCMAFHHGPFSLSGSVFLSHSVFLSFTDLPLYPLNKALALSVLLLTLSLTQWCEDTHPSGFCNSSCMFNKRLITRTIQTHLLLLCPFKRSVIEVQVYVRTPPQLLLLFQLILFCEASITDTWDASGYMFLCSGWILQHSTDSSMPTVRHFV